MANENTPAAAQPAVLTENIATDSGLNLIVEKRLAARRIELVLRARTPKRCLLHWGIRDKNQPGWRSLPQQQWPEGTTGAGPDAMQTPFLRQNGESRIAISLNSSDTGDQIEFALFFPEEGRWDNNGHRNYQIPI